ncbi:MAG: hypothetical protein ACHQJ6_02215 [Candidatus Berkiellales bacterium]
MNVLNGVDLKQVAGGCMIDKPEGVSDNCWAVANVAVNSKIVGIINIEKARVLVQTNCSELEQQTITKALQTGYENCPLRNRTNS